MKHLTCLLLYFISLDGFGQSLDTTIALRQFDASKWVGGVTGVAIQVTKPDTIRALLLITASTTRSSIPHTKIGYVVKGADIKYLDCDKREIKLPVVVWGWKMFKK
jgi:hypothetical protein